VGRTSSLLVAMQRALAAFGLGAALLFGVHGERAMEHAGDIQQLGAIDFAEVEEMTKKLGEAEERWDAALEWLSDTGTKLVKKAGDELKKAGNQVVGAIKKAR